MNMPFSPKQLATPLRYTFSKKVGAEISLATANAWIKNYKAAHKDEIHGYFFGTDLIQKILSHPEAVGMRICLAYEKNPETGENEFKMVLMAAREDGSNILPTNSLPHGPGTIGDSGLPCPPYC